MIQTLGFLGVRTRRPPRSTPPSPCTATCSGSSRSSTSRTRSGSGPPTAASVHVYGPADDDHDFFGSGPVVGLVVDDFDADASAMVAAGIEFVGEPQRAGDAVWNHYVGPDGNVYEIIGRPSRMADEAVALERRRPAPIGRAARRRPGGLGPALLGRRPGRVRRRAAVATVARPDRADARRQVDRARPDAPPRRREPVVAGGRGPARRVLDRLDDACCTSGAARPASPVGSPRSRRRRSATAGRTPAATGSSS